MFHIFSKDERGLSRLICDKVKGIFYQKQIFFGESGEIGGSGGIGEWRMENKPMKVPGTRLLLNIDPACCRQVTINDF